MYRASRTILFTLLWFGNATAASAHPDHSGGGFVAGMVHPLTGLDHMLAMVAVGLLAASRGGKALWAWPAAFVGATAFGFVCGRAGLALPLVEPMILSSVIVFGLLIASMRSPSVGLGAAVIAVFGLFHGQAHAVEAGTAAIPAFAAGFIATSIGLHLCGIGLGRVLRRTWQPWVGAATALGGFALVWA